MPARPPQRPSLRLERRLSSASRLPVAGLDEVGRGALAGPLVAAAVVLPLDRRNLRRQLDGVRDSKQMTDRQRRQWAERVRQLAADYGLGLVTAAEIDRMGPLAGTLLAMERALDSLTVQPGHLLLDHVALPRVPIQQTSITHGDASVLCIAAASVLAKVWRDDLMELYDRTYPGYGFAQHKGYGTAEHVEALRCQGPSPLHRRSFQPVWEAGEARGQWSAVSDQGSVIGDR